MVARMLRQVQLVVNRAFSSNHLLVANTVSCGTLMGLGDVAMQHVENLTSHSPRKHDWNRTGRMVIMGVVLGPINHAWYTFLDRVLPAVKLTVVARKILADQIVASPFFAFTFFMGMGTLEGQHSKQSWDEFRGKFWNVYKTDWCFWPPIQAINFTFVSPKFRVVYVAAATFVWNTFLSYVKHREECHDAEGVDCGPVTSTPASSLPGPPESPPASLVVPRPVSRPTTVSAATMENVPAG